MTGRRFLASCLLTLLVGSALVGRGQERKQVATFAEALSELRSVKVVGSSATGFMLKPGRFFDLSKEILRLGTADDFEELLDDEKPVVRIMGLVCLAQTDMDRYTEVSKKLEDDQASVEYVIGCVIKRTTVAQVARWLKDDPFYFGREAGVITPKS